MKAVVTIELRITLREQKWKVAGVVSLNNVFNKYSIGNRTCIVDQVMFTVNSFTLRGALYQKKG